MDGDDRLQALQNALALAARLEPASIEEFRSELCPDQSLSMQLPRWLDQAEDMTTHEHPKILACRLHNECYGLEPQGDVLDRGLKAAAQYPNWNPLLLELGRHEWDRFMAAGLYAASMFNLYLDAMGGKSDEVFQLAIACGDIHRQDVTMELLSMLGPQQPRYHMDLMLFAFFESGHFAEAADIYPLLPSETPDQGLRQEVVPDAALTGVVLNKPWLASIVFAESNIASWRHRT